MAEGADSLEGVTFGVVTETLGEGVSADVAASVRSAVGQLEALGATMREVSLPRLSAATSAYYVLAPSGRAGPRPPPLLRADSPIFGHSFDLEIEEVSKCFPRGHFSFVVVCLTASTTIR